MAAVSRFLHNQGGATSIEYATIAALLAITCLSGARLIGINLSAKFLGPLANGFP